LWQKLEAGSALYAAHAVLSYARKFAADPSFITIYVLPYVSETYHKLKKILPTSYGF